MSDESVNDRTVNPDRIAKVLFILTILGVVLFCAAIRLFVL